MQVVPVELRKGDPEYSLYCCRQLEQGNILLLQETPFLPMPPDAEFMRTCRQSGSTTHKNIAYKPIQKRLTGVDPNSADEGPRLEKILSGYSEGALAFLAALLPPYAGRWRVDYASFRSVEEEGRALPIRHRNDLMHLDAFPTRPTHGGRILRLFSNLNSTRGRVWATSKPFEEIATRYAKSAGLNEVMGAKARTRRAFARMAHQVGLKVPDRSAYDEFMLGFHHFLKGSDEFQKQWLCDTTEFAPGTTWISFTDQIAHAVLSGQYALEQTVIVPYEAMVLPDLAPVAVLQRLAGQPLVK